jgi:hypothetical protein
MTKSQRRSSFAFFIVLSENFTEVSYVQVVDISVSCNLASKNRVVTQERLLYNLAGRADSFVPWRSSTAHTKKCLTCRFFGGKSWGSKKRTIVHLDAHLPERPRRLQAFLAIMPRIRHITLENVADIQKNYRESALPPQSLIMAIPLKLLLSSITPLPLQLVRRVHHVKMHRCETFCFIEIVTLARDMMERF